MTMASEPPPSDNVLQLIDWFDLPDQLILVLERPDPCVDLVDYVWQQEGHVLPEHLAKSVMRQAVLAAHHCHGRGVLHRDIKGENLLVNTKTQQMKLIDFGCGDLLQESPYEEFDACKDLITWCLAANPLKRPDLPEILQHPWFSEESCPT